MATSSWTTPIDHTSDTGFRTWGSELNSKLSAIGLVQTADTGQINWSTVNRPAINIDAGYEIWRFNDTQQSTSPIYIKLLYGTSGVVSAPRIGWQVGSATNGAGVMAGQNTAPQYVYGTSTAGSSTSSYPSFLSYSDGFFALLHKCSGYYSSGNQYITPCLIVARTVDSTTQAPTSEGAAVYQGGGYASNYSYNYLRFISTAANTSYSSAGSWSGCIVPGVGVGTTSTVFPASITNAYAPRVFTHWSMTPAIKPMIGVCTVNVNDVPLNTKFTATIFGSTPRTYLCVGNNNVSYRYILPAEATNSSNYSLAILWE